MTSASPTQGTCLVEMQELLEDIAQAIYLCAAMYARTDVEEIILRLTQARDVTH